MFLTTKWVGRQVRSIFLISGLKQCATGLWFHFDSYQCRPITSANRSQSSNSQLQGIWYWCWCLRQTVPIYVWILVYNIRFSSFDWHWETLVYWYNSFENVASIKTGMKMICNGSSMYLPKMWDPSWTSIRGYLMLRHSSHFNLWLQNNFSKL